MASGALCAVGSSDRPVSQDFAAIKLGDLLHPFPENPPGCLYGTGLFALNGATVS